MADDADEAEVNVLEKLKSELLLDFCSYKLWNEFKRGSQMSKDLLETLKELYISKQNVKFDEELHEKLYCTRFICGLSEARIPSDDGSIKYNALHPMCLAHAEEVLKMYPFSTSEQTQFKSIIRLQVILSAFRAGRHDRAKKLFSQLYLETAESDEEYQDDVQELLETENESFQRKLLLRFSYEKFLQSVGDFLTPLWEKYDTPLLEKFKDDLHVVNDGKLPGFFLKAFHDASFPVGEEREQSWNSIMDETHPDVIEFKKQQRKEIARIENKTTKERASDEHKKQESKKTQKKKAPSTSDNEDLQSSGEVEKVIKKSQQAAAQLKQSSSQLNEFVKQRNQKSGADEEEEGGGGGYDDNDDNDDENISLPPSTPSKKDNTSKKQPANQSPKNKSPLKRSPALKQSPFKRRWNDLQKDAETIEWSLSEDEDHPAIHLPSPKRCLNVILPSPTKRRKKNLWTDEELSWLCKGVKNYGEGNWSTILRVFPFRMRTSVDLKDKWRNHCKKN